MIPDCLTLEKEQQKQPKNVNNYWEQCNGEVILLKFQFLMTVQSDDALFFQV